VTTVARDFFYFDDAKVVPHVSRFRVQRMPGGVARVDDNRTGTVSMVEAATGRVKTLPADIPAGLIAEIQQRWGGAS
jgi:hypothetical protein